MGCRVLLWVGCDLSQSMVFTAWKIRTILALIGSKWVCLSCFGNSYAMLLLVVRANWARSQDNISKDIQSKNFSQCILSWVHTLNCGRCAFVRIKRWWWALPATSWTWKKIFSGIKKFFLFQTNPILWMRSNNTMFDVS